jgi:hypothetical protein
MTSSPSPGGSKARIEQRSWHLVRWLIRGSGRGGNGLRTSLVWLTLAVIVVANQGSSLLGHIARARDPNCFNDDVRQQIFPFFRYAGESAFRDDLISDYYLSNLPIGYRSLYTVAGWLGEAETLSKVLPYLLLAVVIAAVVIAARRVSGTVSAVIAAAIVLGCSLYLGRLGGGLPRSFGYPLIALVLASLALGNATALVVVTCVAAAFYPVAAVVAGGVLAAWLLLLPPSARGQAQAWSLKRRVSVIVMTAGICITVLAPTQIGASRFGRVITVDQVAEFPEIGPGGRYIPSDRAPFVPWPKALRTTVDRSLFGSGTPWFPLIRQPIGLVRGNGNAPLQNGITEWLGLGSLIVWLLAARRQPAVARLLLVLPTVVLGYVASASVAPLLYLPERYFNYTLPLMVALVVATAVPLTLRLLSRNGPRPILVGAISFALLLTIGGRGSPTAGIAMCVAPSNPMLEAVAGLPNSALVAGWPLGIADFIPYCAKRRVFVSSETHQAFHLGYTLEMRRRVSALIDAYSAETVEPIVRLYVEFGVTHLVVTNEFTTAAPPRYFRPFDQLIAAAQERLDGRTPKLMTYLDRASVFRDEKGAILALERIVRDP